MTKDPVQVYSFYLSLARWASKVIILFFVVVVWQKDFTCSLSSSSPVSFFTGRLLAASVRAVAVVEETCIKTGDVGETVMIRGVEVTVEGGSGDGWSSAGWPHARRSFTNVRRRRAGRVR